MYKIGILYMCTGNYKIFWKEFYKSSEKFFLKNHEIHYFVFTDANHIYDEENNNRIHKIYQENLGWPNNTLKRFDIFYKAKNDISKVDFLFFFNANLLFLKEVDEKFLPIEENILVVKHPGFYNKNNREFSYDRNKKSLAYIEEGKGKYYVAGGLNGGKVEYFLELIEKLSYNIEMDLKNGIIALWHDESHLNKYILGRTDIKVLEPSYLYPEGWNLPFEPIILIRDKRNYGGHKKLRAIKKIGIISNLLFKLKLFIRR